MLKRLKRFRARFYDPTKRAEWIKSTTDITMGTGCRIYNNVSLSTENYLLALGNDVLITAGVKFITHDSGAVVAKRMGFGPNEMDLFGRISLGNNVVIGMNSILLPGSGTGNNCVVGAGSVVTKKFGDNLVIAGNPAKVICTMENYFERNDFLHTIGMSYDD